MGRNGTMLDGSRINFDRLEAEMLNAGYNSEIISLEMGYSESAVRMAFGKKRISKKMFNFICKTINVPQEKFLTQDNTIKEPEKKVIDEYINMDMYASLVNQEKLLKKMCSLLESIEKVVRDYGG